MMSTEAAPKTNAKELLDTMLGYLGFVVQIEESGGGRRQPDAADLHRGSRPADRARRRNAGCDSVSAQPTCCRRRIRTRRSGSSIARCIAPSARTRSCITCASWRNGCGFPGRPLQLEPMNSYERRIVHEAFKDDPDIGTWSPSDSARIKQITLIRRPAKKEESESPELAPAMRAGAAPQSAQGGRADLEVQIRT